MARRTGDEVKYGKLGLRFYDKKWTGEALASSGASPGHQDAFSTAWRASRPS
ncbi:hypothetical protein H4Q26_015301 [Puccinia striiformis f. sp. tritici PST-130]|nr:hypothetical protein H4Q26_015301 [Puccinia striiformis f. sp. tritici PST-130]